MRCVDSRRLTGPNLLADRPLAIIDIELEGADPTRVETRWHEVVARLCAALGWPPPDTYRYGYPHDVPTAISLAFGAPVDQLYAATEINDWAWFALTDTLVPDCEHGPESEAEALTRIAAAAAAERNPALRSLMDAASARACTLLWDDDEVSLGMGAHAGVWPARDLPVPDQLDWDGYRDLPLGLVTGTNGKSTTARYAAAIMTAAGRCVGLSSTDWIRAGDELLDRGDYSGPGGARSVLRHPRVDVAVLETARGGIKRRGLAVERADVALICNIAEDHLGDFGVPDVDALLELKWVVSRAVRADGVLILNADDPLLVRRAEGYPGRIAWFGTAVDSEPLASARAQGLAATLEGSELWLHERGTTRPLLPAAEVAMSLEGRARHNLYNALAAALFAHALGADTEAIGSGLRSADDADNPGRMGCFRIDGATVLLDFAHNPHGLQALFDTARALPARRRLLLIGQAGDRRDQDIRALAVEAWGLGLDRVIIKEMGGYARGRPHGEVAGILRQAFLDLGAEPDMLAYRELETDAVSDAVRWAQPGDLVVLLVHEQIEAVVAQLRAAADVGCG
jgi:UDP-N-acetylmuramyl tripeptide synthase